jgi:hypothetical protein
MFKSLIGLLGGLLLTVPCSDSRQLCEANIRNAINQYFVRDIQGKGCIQLPQTEMPMRVPAGSQDRIARSIEALAAAGLLRATPATEIVFGKPSPAIDYDVTELGKRYMTTQEENMEYDFCYTQKRVHSIKSWSKPEMLNGTPAVSVLYSYEYVAVAPWAEPMRKSVESVDYFFAHASVEDQRIRLRLIGGEWKAE